MPPISTLSSSELFFGSEKEKNDSKKNVDKKYKILDNLNYLVGCKLINRILISNIIYNK